MGVMECGRTGCNNIMCDTHVDGIGYICNECQEEFKTYAAHNLISNDSDMEYLLRRFMQSYKDSFNDYNAEKIDEYFKQRTR